MCERKDNVDMLLALQGRHRARMDQRISHAWKISLSLWAALGFFGAAIAASPSAVPWKSVWWEAAVLLVLALVLVAYVWWAIRVGKWNIKDSDLARKYLQKAEEEIRHLVPPGGSASASEKGRSRYYSQILQIVVTFCFLLLIALSWFGRSGEAAPTSQVYRVSYSSSQPSESITTTINNQDSRIGEHTK